MDKQTLSIMLDSIESAIKAGNTELSLKAMAGLRSFLTKEDSAKVTKPHVKRVEGLDINSLCSTDATRLFMNGVYYDPEGYAVATDARAIVRTKRDFISERSGKIISKWNVELNGKFPAWRRVIPSLDTTAPVALYVKSTENALDKEVLYVYKKLCSHTPAVKVGERLYSYKYIQNVLQFFNDWPEAETRVSEKGALVVTAGEYDDPDAQLVIMPLAYDEEECFEFKGLVMPKLDRILDDTDIKLAIIGRGKKTVDFNTRKANGAMTRADFKAEERIALAKEMHNACIG